MSSEIFQEILFGLTDSNGDWEISDFFAFVCSLWVVQELQRFVAEKGLKPSETERKEKRKRKRIMGLKSE